MPPFRPDPLNMFANVYSNIPTNKELGLGKSEVILAGVGLEGMRAASSIGQGADQLLYSSVDPCEAMFASVASESSVSDDNVLNEEQMWWNAGNKRDATEISDTTDRYTAFPEAVEQEITSHSGDSFNTSNAFPSDQSFGTCIEASCSDIGSEYLPEFIQYPSADEPFSFSDSALTAHMQADLLSSAFASPALVASFSCGINGCKKSYKRSYELKRHQKRHSSVRGYGCRFPQCSRSGQNGFVRKDHLKQHMRQVHRFI